MIAPRWLLRGKRATLLVRSVPAGALVLVDGREVGTTPLAGLKMSQGSHEVKLTRTGYREATRRIRLAPGQKMTLALALVAAAELPAPPPPVAARMVPAESPPDQVDAPPLLSAAGELFPEKKVAIVAGAAVAAVPASAAPAAATAAPGPVSAAPAPGKPGRDIPAEAIVPPPAAAAAALQVSASVPLYKRWYFWGGAVTAATLLAVGVMAALPAQYTEKRDPSAACGGNCGVVVNHGP